MSKARKSGLLRRYPALGFVVAAGALALLLPTALNVPQSGPTTLAEFAPVPGAGQGTGDVSELGQAGSGGLGFGSGTGAAALPESSAAASAAQRRAKLKRCVGSPSRQTEDPLSPPCVAFFEGSNGGATGKGVTRDEVTAVLWWEGTADARAGQFVDCSAAPSADDAPEDLACKAYTRFFNDRYQTYQRSVRVWAFHKPNSGNSDNWIAAIEEARKPFAIISTPFNGGSIFGAKTASRGIVSAVYEGAPRKRYADVSPHLIGFRPDIEHGARIAASYLCLKLKDRPAQYHGNPIERTKPRKFGFYTPGSSEKPQLDAIANEIKNQCGLTGIVSGEMDTAGLGAAALRDQGVTTVIAMAPQSNFTTTTQHAARSGWFPEWFLPGEPRVRGYDTNYYARLFNQAEWANAFGITFEYRRNAAREQLWYQAAREGCPDCGEPESLYAAVMYDTFSMLFYGIQSAGPRLTPANIDKGMHAIPQLGSPNPYKPAAYFGPGDYSFLKDAMEMWWDPSGTAPGDPVRGCYRLPNEGARFRSGEWSSGDNDIQKAGAPCQGSTNLSNN